MTTWSLSIDARSVSSLEATNYSVIMDAILEHSATSSVCRNRQSDHPNALA